MNEKSFNKMINLFNNNSDLLLKGKWGIEKEAVRITGNGSLALSPHPKIFGDKLKNPYITTDFSESQIEMITPPSDSIEKTYKFLNKIQKYVEKNINNENLWPMSMPPILPFENDIPIAKYNSSELGKKNEIYRYGLALRYGKKMQMISGIHYNFSFQKEFWDFFYNNLPTYKDKQTFINDSYFSIARNYLRYRWLIIYLFGASPLADKSFTNNNSALKKITKYSKYASSLRLSPLGYSFNKKEKIKISFNNLNEYQMDLEKALYTEKEEYKKLGIRKNGKQIQLNYHILQKDSELYSSIRIKSDVKKGESLLEGLKSKGVSYLEIRSIDLNPFYKASINLRELYFLHVFLIYCLFEESDYLFGYEMEIINKNDNLVTLFGRKKDLKLINSNNEKIKLNVWACEIFEKLSLISKTLDKNYDDNRYQKSIEHELKKIKNINLLPSSRIINEIKRSNKSFINFGIEKVNKKIKGVKHEFQNAGL